MVALDKSIVFAITFNQSPLVGIGFIPDWPHVTDGIS